MFAEPLSELLEPLSDEVVVVTPPRIASHSSCPSAGVRRGRRGVAYAEREHGPRLGVTGSRVSADLTVALQIPHGPVMTCSEPRFIVSVTGCRRDVTDTYVVKAEFVAEFAYESLCVAGL